MNSKHESVLVIMRDVQSIIKGKQVLVSDSRRVFLDNGLGEDAKKMYLNRRKILARTLQHPILLCGIEEGPNGNHLWSTLDSYIFQDPIILYYTGLNQLNVAIYLDPIQNKEILFLPKKDIYTEFWEGFQLGVGHQNATAEAKSVTGFKNVMPWEELETVLLKEIKNFKRKERIGCFWHTSTKKGTKKDHHYQFSKKIRSVIKKSKRKGMKLVNIQDTIWDQCLIMDENDQKLLREANQITRKALNAIKRELPKLKTESEVAAHLIFELTKRTKHGLSFAPIVASGKNATTLHYTQNDAPLSRKDLLLLDFGCRRYALCADQSHTIPISGKANPLQALLLKMIRKAQKLVQNNAKPGITIESLNQLAWDSINSDLSQKILKKGGESILLYQDRPHGVSHLIGYQVHDGDPFRNYATKPLKPGMCISNEPGIYGYFELTIKNKLYRDWIGIRLESDLLITKSGCEVL